MLVPITTAGDRDRTKPFGEIGSRGVFVKELEEALLERRIDVAVHSAKDMTRRIRTGSSSARTSSATIRATRSAAPTAIRPGMRVGTASVRRKAQLLALEPSLSIEPLRGNVDTRLRKRGERGLDAVVLAACGLDRLGLGGRDRAAVRAGRAASRRRGRGRSRCRCARARRSWSPRPTTLRRGGGSRPSAVPSPPSAAGASRRWPHTTTGRRSPFSSRPRTDRGSSAAAATTLARSAASWRASPRRDEDRRHPGRRAGGAAGRTARGAGPRRRPLPVDPGRTARGRADRPVAVRLGGRHEPERRSRARAPARGAAAARLAAIGPGTAEALAERGFAPISFRRSRRRRACSPSFPPAACCSRPPKGRGACSWTSGTPTSCRSTARVELHPDPPEGDVVVLASASAARAFAATSRPPAGGRDRPGDQRPRREPAVSSVVGVADSHDVDGLIEVVRRLVAMACRHLPHRLRSPGRLRRHLPRRDQAHRAGRRRSSTSPHGIPPGRVLQGALVLANALPYMPAGVHLAVVDPGVGGVRRPLALRDAEGRLLRRAGQRPAAAGRRALRRGRRGARARQPRLRARVRVAHLPRPRPVLACGRASRARRPARASSARRSTPRSSFASSCRSRRSGSPGSAPPCSASTASATSRSTSPATISSVPRSCRDTRRAGVARRPVLRRRGPDVRDARQGDIILYEDSYRNVAVAVSRGSAADLLGVEEGSELLISSRRSLSEPSRLRSDVRDTVAPVRTPPAPEDAQA